MVGYTPYRRGPLDPVIDVALIENLIARVTDFNARIAPLESTYASLNAAAGGAVNTNIVQRDTIDAVQDQIAALAAYVTDAALASIPITTTGNYANFPPFSVRAYAIENRLNVIGA